MHKPIALFLTDTHLSESNIDSVKSIFKQAIEVAKKNGFKEIYHLGDIFHSRKGQSQEMLSVFDDILDEIAAENLVLRVVPGNHDKQSYSSWKSFLKSYKYHPGIDLVNYADDFELGNGIVLHMLPFYDDEVYIKELNELKGSLSWGKKTILGTHIGIAGAVMNNGIAVTSSVTPALFKDYDLVLVGHYHDAQEFSNIRYIGASIQHNFGETSNKGAILLFDDLSTELIPLEFPKYLTFEVDVNAITLKDVNDLREEKQSTGNFIRTVVTGSGKDVKSFQHRQELMAAGIKVETKEDKIVKEELEARIEPFDSKSLNEELVVFCEKNELDLSFGKKYFDKAIV